MVFPAAGIQLHVKSPLPLEQEISPLPAPECPDSHARARQGHNLQYLIASLTAISGSNIPLISIATNHAHLGLFSCA
ncbi:MAG: hypothetical protein CVV41_20150 [Candidatus Riflebacteria bacterium HGW-Riflebacteria-1]|nr:MAG: hypothetical protein CVV41_20150 [Candidatus Riflebacteria bacterium HGW-Riflebacteria-1]